MSTILIESLGIDLIDMDAGDVVGGRRLHIRKPEDYERHREMFRRYIEKFKKTPEVLESERISEIEAKRNKIRSEIEAKEKELNNLR